MKSLSLILTLAVAPVFATPLHLDVYNPQEKGIYPISSTLVSGPKETVLFDAQFSVKDGEKLVQMIKDSGKTLKTIVITSGDPDFYFGLEPLVTAFPQAEVVASPSVVDHIKATKDTKLAFWGPQMKEGAPTKHRATGDQRHPLYGRRRAAGTETHGRLCRLRLDPGKQSDSWWDRDCFRHSCLDG